MAFGVCRNAACARGISGELIERYPGPGEYCPDCGEQLQLSPAEKNGTASRTPPESVGPKPLTPEAYQHLQSKMLATLEVLTPPAPRSFPSIRVVLVAAAGVLLVVALVIFGRQSSTKPVSATQLHVCGSSLTRQLAGDIVAAYAAQTGTPATRFDLSGNRGCDVRFSVVPGTTAHDAIAFDGVVVVVHPGNPIGRLSETQLRGIAGGQISDWSQVGASPGRIEMLLPDESTDERRTIAATMLQGARIAGSVHIARSGAEIARAVSSASGMRRIGVTAFSAAVPAKVLPIGSAPIPSVLSIGSLRYPLALAVVANVADARNAAAGGLLKYARSADAQRIVARDGLVTKGGF